MNQDAKNEKILKALHKLPENKRCFNCNHLGTTYVVPQFNVFVCTECSGQHMRVGQRVKSINMAKFTTDEIQGLQDGGNEAVARRYLAKWVIDKDIKKPVDRNQQRVLQWIQAVFVSKHYYNDGPTTKSPVTSDGGSVARPPSSEPPVYHVSEVIGNSNIKLQVQPLNVESKVTPESIRSPSSQRESASQVVVPPPPPVDLLDMAPVPAAKQTDLPEAAASNDWKPFEAVNGHTQAAQTPAAASSFDPFAMAKPGSATTVVNPAAAATPFEPFNTPAPAPPTLPGPTPAADGEWAAFHPAPAPAAPAGGPSAADWASFGDNAFPSAQPQAVATVPVAQPVAIPLAAPLQVQVQTQQGPPSLTSPTMSKAPVMSPRQELPSDLFGEVHHPGPSVPYGYGAPGGFSQPQGGFQHPLPGMPPAQHAMVPGGAMSHMVPGMPHPQGRVTSPTGTFQSPTVGFVPNSGPFNPQPYGGTGASAGTPFPGTPMPSGGISIAYGGLSGQANSLTMPYGQPNTMVGPSGLHPPSNPTMSWTPGPSAWSGPGYAPPVGAQGPSSYGAGAHLPGATAGGLPNGTVVPGMLGNPFGSPPGAAPQVKEETTFADLVDLKQSLPRVSSQGRPSISGPGPFSPTDMSSSLGAFPSSYQGYSGATFPQQQGANFLSPTGAGPTSSGNPFA